MKEVNDLLNRLGELEDAPLIWVNKKVYDMAQEIERLNNILDTLMQDMALLNATGKKEIKPKYVFDRISMLRGVDENED